MRVRHEVDEHRVVARGGACHVAVQACSLGCAHAVAVDEGAEVVLAAEREAVAVALEIREIDEVACLNNAARQIGGFPANAARPADGHCLLGRRIQGAARIAVPEHDASHFAGRYMLHEIFREYAARIIKDDILGCNASVLDEALEECSHESGAPIAFFRKARRIAAVRARTVHVDLDGDLFAVYIAGFQSSAAVVGFKELLPGALHLRGFRAPRARFGDGFAGERRNGAIEHAANDGLIVMLKLPPVAFACPVDGSGVM